MAVKIRLARHGKKGFAFYHIVAADSRYMVVAVLGGIIFVKHESCQKNIVLFYPL